MAPAPTTPSTKKEEDPIPKDDKKIFVTSAPPPWHSVALIVLLTAIFAQSLIPAMQSIDEVATLETFGRRLFPNAISLQALVWIRAVISVFIFAVTIHHITYGAVVLTTPYFPNSKLQRIELQLSGMGTQAFFTVWSWNFLGLSFGLNAWLAHLSSQQPDESGNNNYQEPPRWLLRAAVLLFEMVSPCAMLVAFVVKYALWPQMLKDFGGAGVLKTWRALVMHNVNVLFVLAEVGFLGRLPIRLTDIGVAGLYGITYVLFTWASMHSWAAPEHGPQFLYHFFDTTLGMTTSIALVALVIVLLVFSGLFCVLHEILDHLGGGIAGHCVAVVLVAGLVCRFTD